ncbi:MAG: flagellar basal-body rod protein FlgC [Micrococcales bacterium]|nr:MAG: flagellar basal-body rod protein FlgC [Micrococcales bacterium]PIE26559.1 MAG: flagellar basal-body rod protein FlgC [Micrococcales bacterium]
MTVFHALGIAGTGVTVYRKWLDAVSDNIANMNNATTPGDPDLFRAKYVIARANDYGRGDGGVHVGGIALGGQEGRLVYDPTNPVANEDGNVVFPEVELSSQMTQLIMAQRGYQANLSVAERARDAYTAALQLGRSI